MPNKLFAIVVSFIMIFVSAACFAGDLEASGDMMDKLKRGAINTFTGWLEFPHQIRKGFNEGFRGDTENKLIGVVCGAVEGITHSAGRTFSGIGDILGFWAANPKDNRKIGIPLDAEYAWEEGKAYDIYSPNFTDAAITSSVNKFFRGAGNTLFGFIEVPKQISKGISEKSPHTGILKGLWYWASREVSGITDLFTAILPGPEDAAGIHFNEEWEWDAVEEYEE